jgi:hypothetical protein
VDFFSHVHKLRMNIETFSTHIKGNVSMPSIDQAHSATGEPSHGTMDSTLSQKGTIHII